MNQTYLNDNKFSPEIIIYLILNTASIIIGSIGIYQYIYVYIYIYIYI